jgi:serine/threonine protein kinase
MTGNLTHDADREERLNAVLLTYLENVQAGRAPDRRQVLAAHPDLRPELEEFFASHDEVERLAAPIREVAAESSPGPVISPVAGPSELGQLGDFRLLREVGRGGMGVVYEAQQISLRRRVALKVLPFAAAIDPRQLQRFQNEAQAAAHLRHEGIVPVFAVGCERGVHYYAMQFVDGQSLAALIEELRRLAGNPPNRADRNEATTAPYFASAESAATAGQAERLAAASLSRERAAGSRWYFDWVAGLGRQAALALEHAHQTGIVHRDVKPANLLLEARGQLWVTDFGLAQFSSDAGLTMTGEMLGTLRYASPEQALARRGLVDHRSDVYSLGATLYELLTLRPIFDGRDRHEVLRQIAVEEPQPPRAVDPTIPVELETVLLKAVAKEPGDRYATAQELADDLQRFREDRPIRARRPSLLEKATKWARRHRAVVASAVAALLLTVAGLAVATVLTARAYDRERQKAQEAAEERAHAEENFRQARQAVDEFTQIAEVELAGQPHVQGVRRRLLEAALDYYVKFIDQRRDDPAAQAELVATQERVKQILTDLAVLQGVGQVFLLGQPAVRNDLGLTAEQRTKIDDLLARATGPFPRLPRQKLLELARAQDTEMRQILSVQQRGRLRQIELQLRRVWAFREPDVSAALKLTAQQWDRIQTVEDETFRGPPWPGPGVPLDEFRKAQEERTRLATERILALLTPEQLRRWRELIGEPFTGSVNFPQPPFGPPGPPPRKNDF